MILRTPLACPVRGARQNGHAPSRAFGWAQRAIYAGYIVISLDADYRGDTKDFQPKRQLIRKLMYSPTGLSTFFLAVVDYTIGLLSKTIVRSHFKVRSHFSENSVFNRRKKIKTWVGGVGSFSR